MVGMGEEGVRVGMGEGGEGWVWERKVRDGYRRGRGEGCVWERRRCGGGEVVQPSLARSGNRSFAPISNYAPLALYSLDIDLIRHIFYTPS